VSRSPRRWRRAAPLALAATLLLASPAGAHPFVQGGQVPVGSVAPITLAMGHGCGTEDSGGGQPTLEVALEVPEQMRIVSVAQDPAYEHAFDADADGRIEVVTWTAREDGEPAPDLDLEAVLAGGAGDEVYLRVFQGCDGFAYRWIGTPDDPADDPAVRVSLVDPDPDAPAPPEDEPTPAELEAAPTPEEDELGDVDDATVEDTTDPEDGAAEDPDDADGTGTDADPVDGSDAAPQDGAADDLDTEGAAAEADGGGGAPWLVLLVAVALVVGLGALLVYRSRAGGDVSGDAEPSDP
jgi:uncharacterized protein YcnI